MELLLQLQAIGALSALALFYHLWISKATFINRSKPTHAPEPPGAWPIIGHLLQLTTPEQPLFRTLAAMADKYGPAFTVRFGVYRTLVISNWELAKDCFTINDRALANRPRSASSNHLSYNYAFMGLAPYGPYWREVRKWMVLELLSNRRLESLRHVRYAEIDNFIKDLHGHWVRNKKNQIKVEMNRLFRDLTMNNVLKMVVGRRYFSVLNAKNNEEVQRIQSVIVEFFKFIAVSVASDVLPSFLSWLDWDGQQRAMKKTAKDMDELAERWLEEHRQKRLYGKVDDDEQDFIDVMLSILEEDTQLHGHDRDTIVKATALNLIIAATDTTAVSLSWLLSLLLNHKEVLTKAQDELDFHVGKERNVEEKDIENLVYLQAIIKETLRLYPPGPLLVPHEAREDCTFSSGFRVTKGTHVLVNAWKIHRDPRVWLNPLEFQPERFLTSHAEVDTRGKNFEYIPFGSGRRSCPGILFALQTMSMTIARLLHGFNLQTPQDQPVDLTEGIGLTLPKKLPLEVLLSPRLPSHLYE